MGLFFCCCLPLSLLFSISIKVTFEPEMATVCGNLLRIQMTYGENRSFSNPLFHFGDSITSSADGMI